MLLIYDTCTRLGRLRVSMSDKRSWVFIGGSLEGSVCLLALLLFVGSIPHGLDGFFLQWAWMAFMMDGI